MRTIRARRRFRRCRHCQASGRGRDVLDAAAMSDAGMRISPTAAPATYRVRGAALLAGGGTFTNYALTHVARGELSRYDGAGQPEADADTATVQIWTDDLTAAGAPPPKRH